MLGQGCIMSAWTSFWILFGLTHVSGLDRLMVCATHFVPLFIATLSFRFESPASDTSSRRRMRSGRNRKPNDKRFFNRLGQCSWWRDYETDGGKFRLRQSFLEREHADFCAIYHGPVYELTKFRRLHFASYNLETYDVTNLRRKVVGSGNLERSLCTPRKNFVWRFAERDTKLLKVLVLFFVSTCRTNFDRRISGNFRILLILRFVANFSSIPIAPTTRTILSQTNLFDRRIRATNFPQRRSHRRATRTSKLNFNPRRLSCSILIDKRISIVRTTKKERKERNHDVYEVARRCYVWGSLSQVSFAKSTFDSSSFRWLLITKKI